MSFRRAFVALVALSTSVWAAVPAIAAGGALDRPCADVEVITARGSGQAIGKSQEMAAYFDDLTLRLNGAATINKYELGTEPQEGHQYPAVNVSEWWNGNIFGA